MARSKILISINSCWNFVNFRSGLVRALIADGHDVIAVAPEDGYGEKVRELGCRYVPIRMARRGTSPWSDVRLLAQYTAIFRRERPSLFLGYTIKPNVYGSLAAQMHGVPVINNIAGLGTTFQSSDWLNRLVRRLYRLALRNSAIVFFQNPDDLRRFVEDRLVEPAKARLLPGSGVDLDRFRPFRTGAGRQEKDAVFLLVARLLWAKGIAEYVEAAKALTPAFPGAVFRLLGIRDEGAGGVDQASLAAWQEKGLIEYMGSAEDVRPFMADADCIVLPTFYPEGTPRSLLEAAAMAKPIIATDVPGCREIVADGENGWLCKPRDWMDLAQCLERFLQLPISEREAMGRASRHKAETQFDERIVIQAYRRAVEDALVDTHGTHV